MYYIGISGYYEGDKASNEDVEVTQRQHPNQTWNGDNWIDIPETGEQTIARLEVALDRHLDEVANQYRYESIRTMVTYATSEHSIFGNEGRAAVAFRDAVYSAGIQYIQDVNNGIKEIPTEAELIAAMPQITQYL